jgi:hypothetical protein
MYMRMRTPARGPSRGPGRAATSPLASIHRVLSPGSTERAHHWAATDLRTRHTARSPPLRRSAHTPTSVQHGTHPSSLEQQPPLGLTVLLERELGTATAVSALWYVRAWLVYKKIVL